MLRRIAIDFDREDRTRGRDDRALHQRKVEEITADLPALPDFSEFDHVRRRAPTTYGDMRAAFYAGYEESDREHVLLGAGSAGGWQPERPWCQPLSSSRIRPDFRCWFRVRWCRRRSCTSWPSSMKEIHGYNPDLGLSVFTEDAVARMAQDRHSD